jgi:large subunit ribosomal protein L3
MPGRTGGKRITIKNLEIVKIEPEKNLLYIKGAVPGSRGTLLEIKSIK